jgi:hypothetical protein
VVRLRASVRGGVTDGRGERLGLGLPRVTVRVRVRVRARVRGRVMVRVRDRVRVRVGLDGGLQPLVGCRQRLRRHVLAHDPRVDEELGRSEPLLGVRRHQPGW